MRRRGVVLPRAWSRRRLLALTSVLLLAGSSAVAAVAGVAQARLADAVTTRLLDLPPADRVVEVSLRAGGSDGAPPLDTVVRDAVHRALGADGPQQVEVHAVRRTGLVPTLDAALGGVRLVGVAYADLPAHATLVTGAWPEPVETGDGGPVPVVLHDAAARRLQVGPGDVVAVDLDTAPGGLLVTGTYEPTAGDPAFGGDPLEVLGADGPATVGPFVPGASALTDGGDVLGRSTLTWRVAPDLRSARPGDLDGLARGLSRVAPVVRADPRLPDARVSDALSGPLQDVADSAVATRTVGFVPPAVLALVLAGALTATGLLLGAHRREETRTLRARGLSGPQGLRWSLAESTLVASPALLLAGPAAWALLQAASVDAGARPVLVVGAVTASAGAVVLAGPPTVAAHRWRLVAPDRTRAARVRVVVEVLVLAAAAVALWQLWRTATTDPGAVGPLLGIAPVGGLLAGAVVAARVPALGAASTLGAAGTAVATGAAVFGIALRAGLGGGPDAGGTATADLAAHLPRLVLTAAVIAGALAVVTVALEVRTATHRAGTVGAALTALGSPATARRSPARLAATSLLVGVAVGALAGLLVAGVLVDPLTQAVEVAR